MKKIFTNVITHKDGNKLGLLKMKINLKKLLASKLNICH